MAGAGDDRRIDTDVPIDIAPDLGELAMQCLIGRVHAAVLHRDAENRFMRAIEFEPRIAGIGIGHGGPLVCDQKSSLSSRRKAGTRGEMGTSLSWRDESGMHRRFNGQHYIGLTVTGRLANARNVLVSRRRIGQVISIDSATDPRRNSRRTDRPPRPALFVPPEPPSPPC